jgi:PIN domain nuclease of toxin-antitoxin system
VRLLPDTHAIIWWIEDSNRLSPRARELIYDDGNPLLFSAVVAWEVAVKQAIGKLRILDELDLVEEASVQMLDITCPHAMASATLPLHHRDPFDRLLIAQAQLEDAVIVTADPAFAAYDVRTAW